MTTTTSGEVLQDHYVLSDVLGEGSMARVHSAWDSARQMTWALKVVDLVGLSPTEAEEAVELFRQEVEILRHLDHPGFPLVVDAFEQGQRHFLVMELVEGRTLEALVAQNGPCPEPWLIPLARALATCLDVLHARAGGPIIFRDLKPANVMIAFDGTVKLIDFGIARFYKPWASTDTHPLGSPGFAPPEQWGAEQTTPRSDLYALGATLYFALTGTDPGLPGQGHPPLRTVRPECSPEMEALLEHCLQPKPEDRPDSAPGLLEELDRIPAEQAPWDAPHLGTLHDHARLRDRIARVTAPAPQPRGQASRSNGIMVWFMILLGMSLLGLVTLITPGFIRARPVRNQLTACKSNLKNIGTALEMYSTDNGGRFPTTTSQLTPGYLKLIPTCPSVGSNTYSAGFVSASDPDAYTVVCAGSNHGGVNQGASFPQYTSIQGLIVQ